MRSRARASRPSARPPRSAPLPRVPALPHRADRGRLAAQARLRRRRRPLRERPAPERSGRALAYAAHHRSEFMWPWEHEPHSIAHGILDDETYDWLAVVEGMLATGGGPLVVGEETLAAGARPRARGDGHPGRRHRLRRPRRPARPARVRPTSPPTSASPCCSRAQSDHTHQTEGNEMRSFAGRDILSLKGFERAEFEHVFQVCDELEPIARSRKNADLLADKTLLTAFYQPSTRTRLATEAAMHRLGGHVLGFSDAKNTRAGDFYQESIKDTVHMLEYYGDVIAMRHFQQGAPAEAATLGVGARDQLRRRLGRAPDPGADRPLHDPHRAGHARRPHVPARRRHADAHDALDPLRDVAVRHQGVRRRAAGHVAAAGVQGRARRAERALRGGSLGRGRDPRLRRHLHGARRPARLHEVARRARRERRR